MENGDPNDELKSTMRTCFFILLTNIHVSLMSWMTAHMDLPTQGMDPNDISLTHFLPRSHMMIHMEPHLIKEMDPNESNGHCACGCIAVLLLLSLAQVSPSQITTDHSTHGGSTLNERMDPNDTNEHTAVLCNFLATSRFSSTSRITVH
jgi:hypothetical protein